MLPEDLYKRLKLDKLEGVHVLLILTFALSLLFSREVENRTGEKITREPEQRIYVER